MNILNMDKILTYDELSSEYEKLSRRLAKIVKRSDVQAQRLYELNEKLKDMAYFDYMTGVHNRRYFFENATKTIIHAKNANETISLAMLDIDKFKDINDRFGHDIGDEVIKALANKTLEIVRENDIFARFGGEEFVLMLPNTKLSNAVDIVEKIRKDIANCFVNQEIRFSISAGVVEMDLEKETLEDMIKNSDEYLYKAKENGRNRLEYDKVTA